MLFKLSLKNITKSMKDYAIYFFTLILGVAIFYVFNSIESQTVMMNVSKSTSDIIKLMTQMLSGVSVFVSFILGFLIIYASRFLMKRRNKEFGIYLTLGMSKRKISFILFIETLIIGIISLAIGLTIGILLSQLMSVVVASMFEADLTKFQFVFSTSTCIKCLIYFGIMYLLVMIFNTFSVSRCKLIDLFHFNKKSEKIKLKNPWICIMIFVISILVLGYAYYLVTGGIDQLQEAREILIPIALGCIATFFIFWSLSGLVLKLVMSIKSLYYKKLNSFTLRQISSKVNTTVFSMSIICIMLFITICVLSSALSVKNSMTKNIEMLAPIDIEIEKSIWNRDDCSDCILEVIDNSHLPIKKLLKKLDINPNQIFKDTLEISIYQAPELTLKDTLGDQMKDVQKDFPFLGYDSKEDIMKISDYNKVAKLYGNETYQLDKNEYMIIADFESMVKIRNIGLNKQEKINVFGKELISKYKECKTGFVDISSNHINSGIILVSDDVIDEKYKISSKLLANYKEKDKDKKYEIDKQISDKMNDAFFKKVNLTFNTRIDITEASIGLGAMVTFIGIYLGIIFLISSAAILALKELSESSDNKKRFRMLRQLGADDKMIYQALFRQIGIFFLFPLILAIIHSIFGIQFCTHILETFGNDQLLPSIVMTAIFIVIIYGGYFLITYFCSMNIIKEEK